MTGCETDYKTVYVEDPPTRIFGNLLINGCDGQCAYIYAGIEERCPNEAVAHTFLSSGEKVEMCAEHTREDVPEPDKCKQKELVTDGGITKKRYCNCDEPEPEPYPNERHVVECHCGNCGGKI